MGDVQAHGCALVAAGRDSECRVELRCAFLHDFKADMMLGFRRRLIGFKATAIVTHAQFKVAIVFETDPYLS